MPRLFPFSLLMLLPLASLWGRAALVQVDSTAPTPTPTPTLAATLRAVASGNPLGDIRFLADDALEGRAAGTRGGFLAALYIAAQLENAGLKGGAADGSFFQRIRMFGVRSRVSVVVGAGRKSLILKGGEDVIAWPVRPEPALTVDGALVFAGYGIQAARWQWDDYQATSMSERIVLLLEGEPENGDSSFFEGEALTYFGTRQYKIEQADRMGALGVILVHDSTTGGRWDAARLEGETERLLGVEQRLSNVRFVARLSEAAVRRLMETAGRDYEVMVRRAGLKSFSPIGVGARASVDLRSRVRRIETANVIGTSLKGDDSRGILVFEAHYDQAGMGTGGPDSVYNGARDNAAGVVTLLEVARAMAPTPRNLVFLFTAAGSGSGALGVAAFVRDPPVELERIVLVIDLDRPPVAFPVRLDLPGAAESALDTVITRQAEFEDIVIGQAALDARFFTGGAFRFARAGVVALLVTESAEAAAGGVRAQTHRRRDPGDEIEGIERGALAATARLLARLGWILGTGTDYPAFRTGSPFRTAGLRLRTRRRQP